MVSVPGAEVSAERVSQLDAFNHYVQGCECRLCHQGSGGSRFPESIWRGLLLDIRQEGQSVSGRFSQMGKWSHPGGQPWPIPLVSDIN